MVLLERTQEIISYTRTLQKSRPGSDVLVLYCSDCLYYHGGDVIAKAVIDTPMKDGSFDAEAVPVGASVWITVTNPSSPLHGRPIMITKRPDNLFALTGGGGISSDARRHMVLTGSPKKSRRDKDLEEAVKEAEEYNEPLRAARRRFTEDSRRELREAATDMMEAMGLSELDTSEFVEHKAEIQEYVSSVMGDTSQAQRVTNLIMRQAVAAERSVRERVQRERQTKVLKARLGERLDFGNRSDNTEERTPVTMTLPQVDDLDELTKPEQDLVIARHFDQQIEKYFDEDRAEEEAAVQDIIEFEEDVLDADDRTPTLPLGTSIKPLVLESEEKLNEAVEKVQEYWNKRHEVEEIDKAIKKVPLVQITPSAVEAIKTQDIMPMSIAEVRERADAELERAMTENTALSLYDALGEHWNDDISLSDSLRSRGGRDTTMQFHINAGASSALAALGKDVLGARYDTSRLITDGNIELAAAGMALEVARKHSTTSDAYRNIVNQLRQHNAMNQKATEVRALDRHAKLAKQYETIQKQKQSGELLDKVQISTLETDNLIAQRQNLGTALGSLQSSATFLDHLEKLQGSKRAPVLSIGVGNQNDLAEALRDKLNLKRDYDIDVSDPNNIKLNVGLSSISKYVKAAPDVSTQESVYDYLKTSMEGVSEDENGNLVVDDYDVPLWRDKFTDAAGQEFDYKWRVEQRNDIEWLREATKKSELNPDGVGGGLITRVTGAGKTNTALGFFGHKISEDPDYKGLVVVPRGRAAQWQEEAARFSDIKTVLIPDGMAKAEVDEILADSKPGTVHIMGHREAAKSHEVIGFMQSDPEFSKGKFSGVVIDEPQELQARGQSGNMGALGKRLMKLPFNHRVGLTATPARRDPTEAYDLIKWTQGSSKQLGSKAAFVRTFSGFSGGTNAQDSAINKLFYDTIKPFISGDRITSPSFKVSRNQIGVRRSEAQRIRQTEIEQDADSYVQERRNQLMQEARENPRHSLRTGQNWENTLSRRATNIARAEVQAQHKENMNGGDYNMNAKIQSFRQSLEQNPDQKHVVFIESADQRRSLANMFKDMGMNNNHVKNIASSAVSMTGREMASRAKAFRDDPRVRIIMIDTQSASGYNLQSGDNLHVLGAPDSAATYLQAQGRVARMPRVGDVSIHTYQYEDVPTEQAHWNDIDTQLKVLQAASPGMFV